MRTNEIKSTLSFRLTQRHGYPKMIVGYLQYMLDEQESNKNVHILFRFRNVKSPNFSQTRNKRCVLSFSDTIVGRIIFRQLKYMFFFISYSYTHITAENIIHTYEFIMYKYENPSKINPPSPYYLLT